MTNRVLVVGPSWVGDMVMAQTLIASLLKTRPGLELDVLAPMASLAVAGRMPGVRRTLPFEVGHGELKLGYRWQLARKLRTERYAEAFVLPNSLKSALLPAFAGIPRRTGFVGESRYGLLNNAIRLDTARWPRMVDRFVALGDEADAEIIPPRLTADGERQQALLAELDLTIDKPVLALCPGAEFGDAKRWPAAHYAALARHALACGMQAWIFGGPGDREVAGEIEGQLDGQAVSLAGRTSLTDAIDLLALSRLVVSNDSGLMHVAAATGRKTLVVYGSTSPGFTPPLAPDAEVFRLGLECSPCFERVCPLGHKNCLNQLLPEQLFAAVEASAR